jgi:hypothetical protein
LNLEVLNSNFVKLTGRYILIDEQNVKKNNYKIVDPGSRNRESVPN